MKDELKRILNLVRKTGDTMIVTDADGQNAYVVMDLDQYEGLLNQSPKMVSTEQKNEMLSEEPDEFPWPQPTPNIWTTMKPAGDESETWDVSKMSQDEVVDLEKQYQKYAQESTVPESEQIEVKSENTEILPKLAENEEDFGEEQFYLEPIE